MSELEKSDTDPFAELGRMLDKSIDDEGISREKPVLAMRDFAEINRDAPIRPTMDPERLQREGSLYDTRRGPMVHPIKTSLTDTTTGARRSDLEAFVSTGEVLLEKQRLKRTELVSTYEMNRVKITDNYRMAIEALKLEADEALRGLDRRHNVAIAEANRLIEMLIALRDLQH